MTVPDAVIKRSRSWIAILEERAKPWSVIQGCYASLLSDATLAWLIDNGLITHASSVLIPDSGIKSTAPAAARHLSAKTVPPPPPRV